MNQPKKEDAWWRLSCGHLVLDKNQTHYCSYIGSPEFKHPVRPYNGNGRSRKFLHPDELQFIIAHRQCENAFVLNIGEIRRTIQLLHYGKTVEAVEILNRIIHWTKTYSTYMHGLSTMKSENFATFRGSLAPASGAESINFRIVEILSGMKPDSPYTAHGSHIVTFQQALDRKPGPGDHDPRTCWWTPQMEAACKEPSLASAFEEILGLNNTELSAVFEKNTKYPELKLLAETLHRYEGTFLAFRRTHLQVTAQQLSQDIKGTGNTVWARYLTATIETARFFPMLWQFFEDEKRFQKIKKSVEEQIYPTACSG